jgi:hypothetical protein
MARYPSGKGEVCKTFMRRFDSDPRLQPSGHSQQSGQLSKSVDGSSVPHSPAGWSTPAGYL